MKSPTSVARSTALAMIQAKKAYSRTETALAIRRPRGSTRCFPPQAKWPSGAPAASAIWKTASPASNT